MQHHPSSFEEIGVLRISRAVAFAVGLPAFMVGTAVFMLGFSLQRPGILAVAATLHGVAAAALLWWVLSRVFPAGRAWQRLGLAAAALAGGVLWRSALVWIALRLVGAAA